MLNVLSRFFKNHDFTREWRGQHSPVLNLDLGNHSFCGAHLGDLLHYLECLGPTEDKKSLKNGMLRYFSKGVEIDFDEEHTIDGIIIFFKDEFHTEFKQFRGIINYNSRKYSCDELQTEKAFNDIFGEPYWRDEDPDEIILFYEFGPIEWQVEFHSSGELKTILIISPPLLADEKQRQAYSVDKKWPPG